MTGSLDRRLKALEGGDKRITYIVAYDEADAHEKLAAYRGTDKVQVVITGVPRHDTVMTPARLAALARGC